MFFKLITSTIIAALLVTGAGSSVSSTSGQGVQLPEPTVATAAAAQLTEAEAIAVALDHANLTETDVTDLRAAIDRDDRREHWDIRWRSGDWVYEYDIHPETGAILEWDRDYEPRKTTPAPTQPTEPKPTEPKPTEPVETTPKQPVETQPKQPATLTKDEAKAIALKHAGFTADQVTGLRVQKDYDDGIPVYEVEFRVDRWEYDYEIHAESGKILDVDRDD